MRGATRRRKPLAHASEAIDRCTAADAAYFVRWPARSDRVRYAARAELEANAAMLGVERINTPPGRRWFTVVKQIAPGVRTRLFVCNDADVDPEMPEEDAHTVYDFLAKNGSSRALEVEERIRSAIDKWGKR